MTTIYSGLLVKKEEEKEKNQMTVKFTLSTWVKKKKKEKKKEKKRMYVTIKAHPDYISHQYSLRENKEKPTTGIQPMTLRNVTYSFSDWLFLPESPTMLCCNTLEFKSSGPIREHRNDRGSILNL